MTAPPADAAPGDSGKQLPATATLMATLNAALAAGTREAFTALVTDDVRWGGERRGGGNECNTREQAGDHYLGLLAGGVTLHIAGLLPTGTTSDSDEVAAAEMYDASMQVRSPDPDDHPAEITVRLSLRNGLIAEICILDAPASIEVLYVDDCPHYEAFVPHLTDLLLTHGIVAPVTLTRIDGDDDAQTQRFLGSPTLRVGGHDVEPAAAEQEHADVSNEDATSGRYGMQCRLYTAPDGTGATAGTPADQWILDALIDNPVHEAAVDAIQSGDLASLQQLLTDLPGLASTRLRRRGGRTLLHVATDWPGHHPNAAATIAALVSFGADPNAGSLGEHPETPLHWAASADDVDAIDALLVAGADIDGPGAVIAGGTPIGDATAFGQWNAARRLLERGAATNLFEAATLGLVAEVEHHLAAKDTTGQTISSSFWGACHGGHIATAALLLDAGADINRVGFDDITPLDAARRSEALAVVEWLESRGATSAAAVSPARPPS